MSAPSLNGSTASRPWWWSSSMVAFGFGGFCGVAEGEARVLGGSVLGWVGWV